MRLFSKELVLKWDSYDIDPNWNQFSNGKSRIGTGANMGRVPIWGLWGRSPVPEPGLQFHIFGSGSSTGLPEPELGGPVRNREPQGSRSRTGAKIGSSARTGAVPIWGTTYILVHIFIPKTQIHKTPTHTSSQPYAPS